MPTLTPAIAYAKTHGWLIRKTRGGHIAYRKGKRVIFGASTPSDRCGVLNCLAQLRRADREVAK